MNKSKQQYKYYAFISYNSRDIEWGKRLQRKLEHYRMPATLCSERGWERKPIKPVFFAPTDIQPNDLTEEIQKRLQTSRYLIVICSPNSAKSEWVGKEIAYFHKLGRTKQILFFIVDGIPHSDDIETECFNPIVKTLGMPEILAANIHEKIFRYPFLNKERAYVQLISKLLNVEFDTIWQRHKRQVIQEIGMRIIGVIVLVLSLLIVWEINQPIYIDVELKEISTLNPDLPAPKDAVITMVLNNEIKTDTIRSFVQKGRFENIQSKFLNKEVNVKVVCKDFLTIDTTLILAENIKINMYRNPSPYGDIRFWLFDVDKEVGLPHTRLVIDGVETISDNKGNVSLFIPLEKQRRKYIVSSSKALLDSVITMPTTEDFIIKVKSNSN